MVATRETFPLLAELLAEQQRLDTPVVRFSSAHDAGACGTGALAPQLIPLSQPSPGEQYAFEVDLDSCTGCKSCVAACHSLNGLDDTETWRDVGLLVSSRRAHPFTQTVTTACHHCADPACLNGCPVLAYEKDPVTGIVRHLDDQCIGCSYCILKCPYDVPKFSARLGIVRKCDMCHGRLAAGEAPACAQACPTHAIRIVTVAIAEQTPSTPEDPHKHAELSGIRTPISGFDTPVSGSDFLPAAPAPDYTRPTTRYVTRRTLPEYLAAGDATTLRPQPPHWPLAIMLTCLPVAVALSTLAAFPRVGAMISLPLGAAWSAVIVGAAGLAASGFHLGQPLRAWRIFLGWRKSWLSREALGFGAWLALAGGVPFLPPLATASAVVGVAALACSALIYIDTRRHFWRASQTFPRFFGTGIVVGLSLHVPAAAALVLLGKLAVEWRTWFDGSTSARLQRGPLAAVAITRDMLGLAALILLIVAPGFLSLALLLAGELAERHLFFRAVDAPKMPGMPAA